MYLLVHMQGDVKAAYEYRTVLHCVGTSVHPPQQSVLVPVSDFSPGTAAPVWFRTTLPCILCFTRVLYQELVANGRIIADNNEISD